MDPFNLDYGHGKQQKLRSPLARPAKTSDEALAHVYASAGDVSEVMSVSTNAVSAPPCVDLRDPAWQPPTRRQIALLLIAALAVLVARVPRLLLEGRVYAEEGTTYLRYAWNATPLRAFLAPHQGYYSLLDNLCALIAARLLPLSATALFFSWVAATIQLLVVFLAIECEALRTPRERWLAMFALLLVTPNFETWLSLEMCQFLLVVAAAVILISSARRLFPLRTAVLGLVAFSTPAAVPLIPLFWLRTWKQRSPRAIVFSLSLTLPAIMQTLVLVHSIREGDRPVITHQLRALVAIATSRVLVYPFTTGRGAQYYDSFLFTHPGPGWMLTLCLTSAALLVAGFLFFARASPCALALYCGALLSIAFDWYGCMSCTFDVLPLLPTGQGRYFYSANSMLLLALLLAATRPSPRWLARAAAVAFGWLLLTGCSHYLRMRPAINNYPAWLPQVRRWQADEYLPIIVAPDFWRAHPLHLPRRHPNRPDVPYSDYDSLTRHPTID
jgi:hypothetical protein